MRLLLLSDASNTHTLKWANYLQGKGVDLHILSLREAEIEGVTIHTFRSTAYKNRKSNVEYNRKAVLLEVLPQVRKLIKRIKPDIVHSHFLSSFGLFGAVSGFHPFVVSGWGSDITDFPHKSFINRLIIKYVLKKADKVCVLSKFLVEEIAKYTSKQPELIYFGTDFDKFKPLPVPRISDDESSTSVTSEENNKNPKPFIFGTMKGLYKHYGINYLIEAAAIFSKTVPPDKWELRIGGDGILLEELKDLARKLNIEDRVKFLGRLPHQVIPETINEMDLFVVPSLRESFGVAAVEASACGLPIIVTNIGGLPETLEDGKTGFCVAPANPQAIADKLLLLYNDKSLREKMGYAGREYVTQRFSWAENAGKMMEIYHSVLK